MSCSMSIEQKLCKMKKIQLKSMSNAIRCIDHRFAFKNSGVACLALIFNLSHLRLTILHPKNAVWNSSSNLMIHKIPFFPWNWYEPMAEWLRLVIHSLEILIQFQHSAEFSAVQRPVCVALSQSVHWHVCFLYCCAPYNFFFLDFVIGDLALTGF